MNQRKFLSSLLLLLAAIGLGSIVFVLGSSWSVNQRAENDAWLIIDVSGISPGSALEVKPFWVYRSTPEEIKNGGDPYLFVWGYENHLGRPIKFVKSGSVSYSEQLNRRPYENTNHYIELYDGGIFTTAGKYVQGTGNPAESSLRVPRVKLGKGGKYFVYRGAV